MPQRLADRIRAARSRSFVGREQELQLLRSALDDPHSAFNVLYVHGPGGVGKTALMHEYLRIAEASGAMPVLLDGRSVDPSPDAFLLGVWRALGAPDSLSPADALSGCDRTVLLIDTYETIAPLDAWIREAFVPQLPAQAVLVLAGRNPPAPGWRTESGLRELTRIVPLRNLRPSEAREFLSERGVPDAQHAPVLEFTHGHPLALSLVADVFSQKGVGTRFLPEREPHVVAALLGRFVEHVPGPQYRQALRLSALARVTTENLLQTIIDIDDPHELFAWLANLGFIEHGPDGLFPHDLAREVLAADFRWRDPTGHLAMLARVADQAVARMHTARGLDQQRAFIDATFLIRDLPVVKPYYDWREIGDCYAEPATPGDLSEILAMIRRHEGPESARIAEHWFNRQPGGFTAIRGARRRLVGFLALIDLHEPTPEDLAVDPCARVCWDFAHRHTPPRPGEELLVQRFWMDHESYQAASATYLLITSILVATYVNRPRLAWSFHPGADPDYWLPYLSFTSFQRCEATDFEVGGRRYGNYVRDWRAEPVPEWLRGISDRAMHALGGSAPPPAPQRPPLVVLSEPAFAEAVRQALRDFPRTSALEGNSLLRSRVVVEHAGDGPPPAALQALLREAAESLRGAPRTEKFYRAIERTYLDPAPSQEFAADQLGLPFNTYRYHLTRGIQLITAWLWARELHGTAA